MGFISLNLHGMKVSEAQEIIDNAFACRHYKNAPMVDLLVRLEEIFLKLIEIEPAVAERLEIALKKRRGVTENVT